MEQFNADEAMRMCLEQYNKLPKNGKPTGEEWTVAAAILEKSNDVSRVVSFGTGSKCMGGKSLGSEGLILHDAHAEVVARRGFLIYLLEEVRKWHQNKNPPIFKEIQSGKLVLRDDVRYCLVTTVVPCGDAAIMLKTTESTTDDVVDDELIKPKRAKLDNDIYRTGAKCLPNGTKQDPKATGDGYHVTGQVRTKPGRGEPTASVSCSDKMARWNAVGLQGALLSLLIKHPILIDSIVIAGNTHFSVQSLERAVNARVNMPLKIKFSQSSLNFTAGKSENRKRAAPGSIAWNISTNHIQVCVEGRKLGATKGKSSQSALDISKKCLFQRFLGLVQELRTVPSELANLNVDELNYRQVKDLAKDYQGKWRFVKDNLFNVWTTKPVDTFYK